MHLSMTHSVLDKCQGACLDSKKKMSLEGFFAQGKRVGEETLYYCDTLPALHNMRSAFKDKRDVTRALLIKLHT